MPDPIMVFGCHTEMTAPMGSAKIAIRPASITSIGSMRTVPPLLFAFATASSAEATLT